MHAATSKTPLLLPVFQVLKVFPACYMRLGSDYFPVGHYFLFHILVKSYWPVPYYGLSLGISPIFLIGISDLLFWHLAWFSCYHHLVLSSSYWVGGFGPHLMLALDISSWVLHLQAVTFLSTLNLLRVVCCLYYPWNHKGPTPHCFMSMLLNRLSTKLKSRQQ